MDRFAGFSLYAQNFKCFGSEPQGFDEFRRLNLIIGRNNTGKSALLDLVRYAISPYDLSPFSHKHNVQSTVTMKSVISEKIIRKIFPHTSSGGGIPGDNHQAYGMTLHGARMSIELPINGKRDGEFSLDKEYLPQALEYLNRIAKELPNPLESLEFARIAAERDIVREVDSTTLKLKSDGTGATNIVQQVINYRDHPSELVEDSLRNDLNRIMGPDANFTRISVQRTGGDEWEIYLDERAKGRISLSDSGSGLKTILLVLINLLVLPKLQDMAPSKYVFAFEELENNLHPGLQRRLIKYIQEKLVEVGAIAFVTTHAPAVIDMFSRDSDAQILHVYHDGDAARLYKIASSINGHNVLDDLDVKASDLLQANGIVWIEGISDAIYLRRWIDLYCKAQNISVPVEGSEYAFMEYGGKCLNHFDFTATSIVDLSVEDAKWLLPALSVSRNTYVVMDSDKSEELSKINATKLKAAKIANGHWITKGREVENYLPPEVAKAVFGQALKKYDSAAAIYKDKKRTRIDKKKVAIKATSLLTEDNWCHHDLEDQIRLLVEAISDWNPVY